ncbi:hypothetical protein BBJ28_00024212 [Nothophytophthora sp. Chile5]|nr:hypothetical protein BBJ28_00024212 [Nothophytophthora sp. Chile5]
MSLQSVSIEVSSSSTQNPKRRWEMAMKMRGASYAAAAHDKTELHQRLHPTDPDVHSLRKGSPAKLQSPSSTSFLGGDDERVDQGDDESDDFEDDFDEAAAHAAALQEQAEMRAHFNFREERRKTLGDQFVAAMRRKRRLLMRNENLRFRELYKPPEPLAVVLMVSVITVVSLILTKSWPFY